MCRVLGHCDGDLCPGLGQARDNRADFIDGYPPSDAYENPCSIFLMGLRAKDGGEFLGIEPILRILEEVLKIGLAGQRFHWLVCVELEQCFGLGRFGGRR